jgi:ComF family protein
MAFTFRPPHFCIQCQTCTRTLDVCPACYKELPWIKQKGLIETDDLGAWRALFHHDAPISQWIHQLKYQGKLFYAHLFAQLMHRRWSNLQDGYEAIIPVPLHPQKQRRRGFNQSLEIARHLAQLTQTPIVHPLRKIRMTQNQSELKRQERLLNLSGAFELIPTRLACLKRVLIIDDVITTGATLTQVLTPLRQAAPELVIDCWAVTHGHDLGQQRKRP